MLQSACAAEWNSLCPPEPLRPQTLSFFSGPAAPGARQEQAQEDAWRGKFTKEERKEKYIVQGQAENRKAVRTISQIWPKVAIEFCPDTRQRHRLEGVACLSACLPACLLVLPL